VIVDDHPLFREGLKAIIDRDGRFEVVGEAGTGREGLRMARKLQPNLMLVDISLPDQTGIQLTRKIRTLLPETRILIVSVHSKIDYIAEAFKVGATGYVVKESASERLLYGLECVDKGDYFLDSSVSHQVVKKLMESPAKEAKITDAAYGALTPREQEVLQCLVTGSTNKEIAEALFISEKTVKSHLNSIFRKLNVSRRLEAILFARKRGLA